MTDILPSRLASPTRPYVSLRSVRTGLVLVCGAAAVAISVWLLVSFINFELDDPLFRDSTPGDLAVWMAGQAEEDAPESLLGQWAQTRRDQVGADSFSADTLLRDMKHVLVGYTGLMTALVSIGAAGLIVPFRGHRMSLLAGLIGLDGLVFIIPILSGDQTVLFIMVAMSAMCFALLFSGEHVERLVGFFVVLSLFLVAWEGSKALAHELRYRIATPVDGWTYQTYPDLDAALAAVDSGEIAVLLADRNQVDDLIFAYPDEDEPDIEESPYPDLRYINRFTRAEARYGFDIEPPLQGRVSMITPAERAPDLTAITQFDSLVVGTVAESFAEEDFLSQDRELIFLRLTILTDINLPHLQTIAEALLQPARRNGPLLLIRILSEAALYTWAEAGLGFVFGATLGFLLGTVFAHVRFLQRSLLPYVVASQTIPIIALAPVIVIWFRETHPILPVAIIASYLTFFPVTINTLRGLQSPAPTSIELMESYAASKWQIMWKLRFPAALPFIFTALKVSATASVVGAIIGELPSGIADGLGRAILNFASDYSVISTPKLWSAILLAASIGILSFVIVSIIEMIVLRGRSEPQ